MPTVKQNIRAKLAEMVGDMTVANGFSIGIDEVNSRDVSFENIKNFPAVNILLDDTEILNYNESSSDAQMLRKKVNGFFDCYMKKAEDQEDAVDLLEADFEKRFLASYPMGGAPPDPSAFTLEGMALEILLNNLIPFNIRNNDKLIGVLISFSVWYRQDIQDPTIAT